jgi:hypothetical protein
MNPTESVLQSSRREARFVAVVWLGACAWVCLYAWLFAYRPGDAGRLTFGMPSWVVWGVLAPWMVCLAATVWFALAGMRDEVLWEGAEGETEPEYG